LKIGEIIIPPRYVEIEGAIIFLAGPIQGGPDWQKEAIRYIHNKNSEIHIASPRRPGADKKDFTDEIWNEQIYWEHFYFELAEQNGVIMFWLAGETNHRCDRAYAQTTRFEIGEAAVKCHFDKAKVVVGIEDNFTGGRYISMTLDKKYSKVRLCHNSLKRTCELAVLLALE